MPMFGCISLTWCKFLVDHPLIHLVNNLHAKKERGKKAQNIPSQNFIISINICMYFSANSQSIGLPSFSMSKFMLSLN